MAKGRVIIKNADGTFVTDADLILESDVSLGISSSYQPLLGSITPPAILTAGIAATVSGTSGFRQQGFQVWSKTEPISLKLSVSLHMKTSGKLDVVEPAEALMAKAVPALSENGWGLIPPGPNILDILGDYGEDLGNKSQFLKDQGGYVSVSISNYINLSQCVMKNVIPTYNLIEDSDGYPISCKLDIDLQTLDIANSDMINGLSLTQ